MVSCWKGKKNWSHSYLLTGMDSAARLKMIWAQYWHLKILKGNPVFNGHLYKQEGKTEKKNNRTIFCCILWYWKWFIFMLSVGALRANTCRHTFLSIVVIWKISLSSAFTFFFPLRYIRRDITHDLHFIFTLILLKLMQTTQPEIFYYFVPVTFF